MFLPENAVGPDTVPDELDPLHLVGVSAATAPQDMWNESV